MKDVYVNTTNLLVEEAVKKAKEIKGWNIFEMNIYAAQRARMLGVNGERHPNPRMNKPLVNSDSLNKTSIVLEEIAKGKFYEV